MRFTTQKASLCHALLNGEVLSIMDAFKRFGMTNLPREISRQVEAAFNVYIIRTPHKHETNGHAVRYFTYHLLDTSQLRRRNIILSPKVFKKHQDGLMLMKKYVKEHSIQEVFRDSWMTPEEQKTAKFYADEAAKRVIPRCGKTTSEIIRDSSYTKEQIAEQKRKKK